MSNKKPLTVYKASAGSGKTFTLASEYIRLLVENPQQFRSILAVTFTNKATEEMKMRILSQLYGIWKQLDDSKDYVGHICEMTGYDSRLVSDRAGIALKYLLHNYSYFRVSTIDTFFQSVLRNLARELELTANLRIELNDTQVEEQAVDVLIQDLQTTDLMLKWVLRYVMDNIDEDHSWNVINSIKQFGTTIFKDYYKEYSDALNRKMSEEHFFEHFTERLNKQKHQVEERMAAIGKAYFETLNNLGLAPEDIKNGKNVATFFRKLQDGIFGEDVVTNAIISYSEDSANWCKKSDMAKLAPVVEEKLLPLLREALEERKVQWHNFQSATLTLRHLNQLRLLGEIEQKVRAMNSEANRFLLSDTQQLLHQLMASSDSPFIFEKIGAQLEHIMIDEFQDTSTVQWQNFKVLLEECMSHTDTQNLIVGDVKQSIYRWRSGDWRLLNNIESHFPMPGQQLEVKPLKTNYRSQRNIIDFNNCFFTSAAQQEYRQLKEKTSEEMAQQICRAYDDVAQLVPENRKSSGKVSVTLYPASDYQENMLSRMGDIVMDLMQHGAKLNDMAILIRSKNAIPAIIGHFAANMPDVRVVSDEAFQLNASTLVCMLIDALRLLAHPDDDIVKSALVKSYHSMILQQETSDAQLIRSDISLDTFLPDGYLEKADELLKMPLYNLMEHLYKLFDLHVLKDENAYLCTFYDSLNDFVTDNSSDIDSFLRYWDETLYKKTIQSDEVNGIRLLTIHKSKGLEFEHVILPFCDWQLEHVRGNVIWCQPEDAPYNELPLVPIDYSGKMIGSTYEQAYLDEYLQNRVDNLNLLYVAFTRARSNLFVIGKRNASQTRSKLIEDVLPEVHRLLEGSTLEGTDDKNVPLTFEHGNLYIKTKAEKHSGNVFLQHSEPLDVEIMPYSNKTSFRQSNKSRNFIEGNDEENQQNNYMKAGSVLHEIFSHIRTTADIESALQQLQMDGILYDKHLTREYIGDMLRKRLEDSCVRDWFSGRWQLFNECTILFKDPETGAATERRPDRVMTDGQKVVVVDFKFGKPKEAYNNQVREYMQLLCDMGYNDVQGYLWYVYSNKIVEV